MFESIKNFFLNPQNLHFLLALIMLMPFTFFVIFAIFMSWIRVSIEKNTKSQERLLNSEMLEDELKRELALFQRRRQEAEEEKKKKTLEEEQERQKRARAIQESKNFMTNIKGFSFNEKRKENSVLLTMILDLMSRQVDLLKIARILRFQFKEKFSEDDVLELVAAIKDFLEFLDVTDKKTKAEKEKILKNLINGDLSAALNLLQTEAKANMEKAKQETTDYLSSMRLDQAAHFACLYAVLSRFEERSDSLKALSWALKISPTNVVAWNLLGNLYLKKLNENKAFEAYENVLRFEADTPLQSANAHKILSLKSYADGDANKALKHYQKAQNFYHAVRVNENLTQDDVSVLEIMSETQNTQKILEKLLNRQRQ